MLKAIQILGSSSFGFVSLPCRFKRKPQANCDLYFLSRKPIKASNLSSLRSKASSFAFRVRKGRDPIASQMSHIHSDSNPYGASSSSSTSTPVQSTGSIRKINFCQSCGGRTKHEIPDGEEKMRAICTSCGKIIYENPKMVVGCLIEHENKILLCKRKIHPSFGLWTLPAGYMEIGESAAEGAIRETWEEANAEVEVLSQFAHLDIPLIGQTYIIFLAKLKRPHFSPGPESSECQLFALNDIPFDSLAFSSMLVTLQLYIEDTKVGRPMFHYGIINKRQCKICSATLKKVVTHHYWFGSRPGTSPSEIHAYTLDHRLKS